MAAHKHISAAAWARAIWSAELIPNLVKCHAAASTGTGAAGAATGTELSGLLLASALTVMTQPNRLQRYASKSRTTKTMNSVLLPLIVKVGIRITYGTTKKMMSPIA